jgi:hypothetical protein
MYGHEASFSDSETSFIANHFNLVMLNPNLLGYSAAVPQAIKTKNSAVKILSYWELYTEYTGYADWSTVNSHEEWFLHDASGNRIMNTGSGWLLMDVGSSGWRSHFVTQVNSMIDNSYYDGVFADDVHATLPSWWTLNATVQASDIARWHNDTVGMLQYAKSHLLSEKLVIVNTDDWVGHDYLDAVDGICLEGFAHGTWNAYDDFSGWSPSELSYVAFASGTGKYVWAASGCDLSSNPSSAQIDQAVKCSYAAYLLALNGSMSYWSFNDWNSYDGSRGFYPIMDTNIGQATSPCYLSQGVYMRNFTNGIVLLNPSSSSQNVGVGGGFEFLNGSTVTDLRLAASSAEILQNSSQPTTPCPSKWPTQEPSWKDDSTTGATNHSITRPEVPSSPSPLPSQQPIALPTSRPTPTPFLHTDPNEWAVTPVVIMIILSAAFLLFEKLLRKERKFNP